MTNSPHIDEAAIRARVTESSYDRGLDYYHQGAVECITERGGQLFAEVHGSEWDPYQVGVTFAGKDFTASCTCPYDWGGYCKHVVATLLAVIDDDSPVPISTKPPVSDLIAGMNAAELRALVQRLVAAAPTLAEVVDEFCA